MQTGNIVASVGLKKLGNTELVVWGSNISSTVGAKFTRAQLAMVKFPPYVRDVIMGLLLSDAYL